MANRKHVKILKQGADVWNHWRKYNSKDNSNVIPHLFEADLFEANLVNADLSGFNLNRVDLGGADLTLANLIGAELIGANLGAAILIGAKLIGANLSAANLDGADLRWAFLDGADYSRANVGRTIFGDVDLSNVKGLETIHHTAPSTIGIDTIYKSGGKIPEVFLRGAGVPDNFITFMHSLTGEAIKFYSCFMSHSSKDQEFVERLYADLQSNSVRCWYAPEDLKIGEPFVLGIEQGIRLHDKLLLILSESSVNSGWVQQEVLSAMAKEQGKAPWVLFPIRLDDAVIDTNVLWANKIRQSRHIGDFTHWKDHDIYRKAFDRLLRDLKEGE